MQVSAVRVVASNVLDEGAAVLRGAVGSPDVPTVKVEPIKCEDARQGVVLEGISRVSAERTSCPDKGKQK